MLTGRSALGKIVMLAFVLFNVVILCLVGLAYILQNTPAEDIRADVVAKMTEIGKEMRDDRKLSAEEMAEIEEAVASIMEVVVFAQQKGLSGLIVIFAFGLAPFFALLYFTRPQPV